MARVDFTASNFLAIGLMAAAAIILLKMTLRVVPVPEPIRGYVAMI